MSDHASQWKVSIEPLPDQRCEQLTVRAASEQLASASLLWFTPRMACLSGLEPTADSRAVQLLMARLVEHCRQRRARLITALREPLDAHRDSFYEHGFAAAARISFQAVGELGMADTVAGQLVLQSISLDDRQRWEPVVAATFSDTLDCPELREHMSAGDALDCFQQTDFPHIEGWLATAEQGDVGCLILGFDDREAAGEILYLGVTPAVRGRRLGRQLVTAGLARARRRSCRRVCLGVDVANRPAVNLYHQCGFREYDQSDLLWKSFSAAAPLSLD